MVARDAKRIKFIDLFAGIGGFRLAFESLGAECVFSSEIDKYAIQTYQANFNETPSGDITTIDLHTIPQFDILCGGFPCQAFSIAGKRKGFDDPRGTLINNVYGILKMHQPKAFLLENVRGLLSHNKGQTFESIKQSLTNCNYDVFYKVLRACDYGLPTNRPRLYIIGYRKDLKLTFDWPEPIPLNKNVGSILEENVASKYTITPKMWEFFKSHKEKHSSKNSGFGYRLYDRSSPKIGTLTARYYKDGKEALIQIGTSKRTGGYSSKIDDSHNGQSYIVFSDVREGSQTVHSWDMIETTQREKDICLLILRNRRKNKYGNKDGNPLSFLDIKELLSDIEQIELKNLCDKKILKEIDGRYDFVNSRQLAGINGTYRVFFKDTQIFPTLTATGTNDKIHTYRVGTIGKGGQGNRIYSSEGIGCALTSNGGGAGGKTGVYLINKDIRRLTPRECARLMGFPDSFKIVVSDNQAYKQFGNSVAVDVIKILGNLIIKDLSYE